MPDYIVGDRKYTEEEANTAASGLGMDLSTWKQTFNAKLMAGNQLDPAENAEANAGSENNQASNQKESGSFGNPSSSVSLLNRDEIKEETPEWISQIYEQNPYDPSAQDQQVLMGGGFEHNINLLKKEREKYSMMDQKSFDIDDEIKRLEFEQNDTGERNRTRRSRNHREVKNKLSEYDDQITRIYSDESLNIDEQKTLELAVIEDKNTYLNFGISKAEKKDYEENLKILELSLIHI